MSWIFVFLLGCLANWFLETPDGNYPDFAPYSLGEEVPIECIQRKIDHGEVKLNRRKQKIFKGFPRCKETGDHLKLKFGKNQLIKCTVTLTDELFHLFQIYLHEDAPFSCRLPITKQSIRKAHQDGLLVPLTFNLRGRVAETSFDIDNSINMVIQTPKSSGTILSAIAWSSGTNTTRVERGGLLTMDIAVRWLTSEPQKSDGTDLPFPHGFYALPNWISYNLYRTLLYYGILVALAASGVTYCLSSAMVKRLLKYNPVADDESGEKRD